MATDNNAPGSDTCEPLEETRLQQEATSGQEAVQQLAAEYRPSMDVDVLHSWAAHAAAALAATHAALEASQQSRLQAEALVKQFRQQAAQEANEAAQAFRQNQMDVRKFCQGMESGLLSAASQLEQAISTAQVPEVSHVESTQVQSNPPRPVKAAVLRERLDELNTQIGALEHERELTWAALNATDCYETLDTPGNLKNALHQQGRLADLKNNPGQERRH